MPKRFSIPILLILFLTVFINTAPAEDTLTWQECVAQAAKNNPDIIYALEGVRAKEEAKAQTTSTLYPQISADAAASKTKTTTTKNSYSYGISGTQLIFDGSKTSSDVKAAVENINAARQSYRFTSSDVRLNLRTAFVNLLKAQELIKVAQEIVKIRRDNLLLITMRYESGLEHKGALLTAKANLADAQFGLSQAKRDIGLYQRQLDKEMGLKEFKPFLVKGDFSVRDSAKDKPDFKELVNNNPSVLEAVANKNSAAFTVTSAYRNFIPKLSGSAGADKSGAHWPPNTDGWNFGLSLDVPIFEGGLKNAQLKEAEALYKQAQASEDSARSTAIVGLEQAWVSLQDAIETTDVENQSLEAAVERSVIAEAQYSTGFINFDNWIIIQNDLVGAKRTYLNAQASALLAEASWIKAKGETLEYAQ
ncbi:MAG: TolC family protein [Candidatus Omnitrophica bacterium]|nr:TolC family protein [Candidatus Omnitrophota bacterium]